MSDLSSTFSTTLTTGIQDIAALLPLIGTEQCENHIGSALEGGFLYAAAAPLSIFGSLGIVKTGVSVLIASISIPALTLTRARKLSLTFSGLRWYGARALENAGFKLVGTVAPMISMDKTRYTTETRLLQMLNEKHIDNPESISVEWKSAEWNVSLILCTLVAAVISGTPYIHLISKDLPGTLNFPWLFPILRTLGSCVTAVCCQFLIQSRVISIMKNRIIFMTIDRLLLPHLKANVVDKPDFRWESDLVAEECLSSLEHYLNSALNSAENSANRSQLPEPSTTATTPQTNGQKGKLSEKSAQDFPPTSSNQGHITIPMELLPSSDPSETTPLENIPEDKNTRANAQEPLVALDPGHLLDQLQEQRKLHFPNPVVDWVFIVSSWILLLLALPAALAGYVGCFTLVSSSQPNGPLIWLGLEVALCVVRILLWASNPSFDENTDVTLRLRLTDHEPLVTTEKDVGLLGNTLPLVPEHRFLELITSYTGPLEQFKGPGNTVLYFTLSGDQSTGNTNHLFMTVIDLNTRMAFVVHRQAVENRIVYVNSSIDTDKVEMQATLLSEIDSTHPWKINHPALLDALSDHYVSLLDALNRANLNPQPPLNPPIWRFATMFRWHFAQLPIVSTAPSTAALARKWSFEPMKLKELAIQRHPPIPRPLLEHDTQYFQRGYEHHLKTKLVEIWSDWIVEGMKAMRRATLLDCHHALEEPMRNEQAKQYELYVRDLWLVLEWTKHEHVLLEMTMALENILHSRMEQHIKTIVEGRKEEEVRDWFSFEWSVGRKKRLENERARANERMERAAKEAAENIEREGQSPDNDVIGRRWLEAQALIGRKWATAIKSGATTEESLEDLNRSDDLWGKIWLSFKRRSPNIRREMEATVEQISNADPKELDQAYHYPKASPWLADAIYSSFGNLGYLSRKEEQLFAARLSIATVYDVIGGDVTTVHQVTRNPSARSVGSVDKKLIQGIEENDHLLYLSNSFQEEVVLPFIQNNRERWWKGSATNSFTFYLSPVFVSGGACAFKSHTIACLMISLQTTTCLRIRLLHRRGRDGPTMLSIREGGNELRKIHSDEIPMDDPKLHSVELDPVFEAGRHELQLVVTEGLYALFDILVEFVDIPSRTTA